MRAVGLIVALLATLLLAVLPSRAAAEIRIQHGIAGVTLGMTRSQVTEILGPADRIAVSHLGESQVKYVRAYWGARKLEAAFIDTTEDTSEGSTPGTSMLSVETRNRAQRTRSGIGVGSTERAVRRRVRDAACTTYRGRRSCAVGDPGSRQTTFSMTRGRVAAVSVSDVF